MEHQSHSDNSPRSRGLHEAPAAPSSPPASQYSLDLAALDLESPDSTSTPIPKRDVDHVLSEDIDGPTDFTVNLSKWMRANPSSRALSGSTVITPVRAETRASKATSQHDSSHCTDNLSEKFASADPQQLAINGVSSTTEDVHNRSDTSHLQSKQDGVASHRESQPSQSVSPEVPSVRRVLQPTVEEYQSELLPSPQIASKKPNIPLKTEMPEAQSSPPQSEASDQLSRISASPASSVIRSPKLRRPVHRDFSSQTEEAQFHHYVNRIANLERRCHELEVANAGLDATIVEERRLRRQDSLNTESRCSPESVHEADYEADVAKAVNVVRSQYEAVLRRHEEQIEIAMTSHTRIVQALEQDLELARLTRDSAIEDAKLQSDELHQLKTRFNADHAASELVSHELSNMKTALADARDREAAAIARQTDLLADCKASECKADALRAELSISKQVHVEHTTRLTADHQRAVKLAEGLQSQVESLSKQFQDKKPGRDEQANLTSPEEVQNGIAFDNVLQSTRDDLEARQSQLNCALVERDALEDELALRQKDYDTAKTQIEHLNTEIDRLNEELSTIKAVNSAMDDRISNALCRRETFWRGRMGELEQERKVMAKALLEQWGREEMGAMDEDESMQKYLYKYVKRVGK